MYKAHSLGIHTGRHTGERYAFHPGDLIEAPNGDLWGYAGVEWIGDEKEKQPKWAGFETGEQTIYPKPFQGTVKQIKDWLDREGVDYPSKARKAELLEILDNV
jgi:hypothetical protein